MEKELLDKEVYCICDVRQIQKYLFSRPTPQDIVGANKVMQIVLQDAIKYAMENVDVVLDSANAILSYSNPDDRIEFFHNKNILMEVVNISAGNAFILFRSGELCQKMIRYIYAFFTKIGSNLGVAISAVPLTDDRIQDNKNLYQKLDQLKACMPINRSACALPIMKTETYTGLPVVDYDEDFKEWVSTDTKYKHKKLSKLEKEIAIKDKFFEINNRIAYVHLDGNNMGMQIANILSSYKDTEEGLKAKRKLDYFTINTYKNAYTKTLDWYKNMLLEKGSVNSELYLNFKEVHLGGDDINFIINAKYAFKFVERLMLEIKNNNICLDGKCRFITNTCAGIVFVNSDINYGLGCSLADDCCSFAKKRAKLECNLINGISGNWIDFQIFNDNDIPDLDVVRESSMAIDGSYKLMLRPYCLDDEFDNHPLSYKNFKKNVKSLISNNKFKANKSKLLEALQEGSFENYIFTRQLVHEGLLSKEDLSNMLVEIPGENVKYSKLYDVVEVGGLYV